MASAATLAFRTTVRRTLHTRASDYVMWIAGHGADSATILGYMDALHVFESHFEEWAHDKSRAQILAALPIVYHLLGPGWHVKPHIPSGRHRCEGCSEDVPNRDPVPPAVSIVATLALQHHLLAAETQHLYGWVEQADPSTQAQVLASLLGNSLGWPK